MERKKKVLFVCVQNSCRSQMAEGFARRMAGDILEPYSAGSNPADEVSPSAVAVMAEAGIDISSQKPKGFAALPAAGFDYLVGMGCSDTCPFFPAARHIQWEIPDPKGQDIEVFRQVRDIIRERVAELARGAWDAGGKDEKAPKTVPGIPRS